LIETIFYQVGQGESGKCLIFMIQLIRHIMY